VYCTLALDQVSDRVAVICLVGEHDGAPRKIVEQDIRGNAVGKVAGGQQEAERAALAAGKRASLLFWPPRLIPITWTRAPLSKCTASPPGPTHSMILGSGPRNRVALAEPI
jgi:hypothetical protein